MPDIEFSTKAAGHAFFNDTNCLGTYNETAAVGSWQRTVRIARRAGRSTIAISKYLIRL